MERIYDYAAKIRAGELDWQDVEDADINTRLKWSAYARLEPATRATCGFLALLLPLTHESSDPSSAAGMLHRAKKNPGTFMMR